MVLFMLDFHHVILSSIVNSYKVMPLGGGFDPQGVLITLTNALETTFYIMLRLASPFLIYGLLFNVAHRHGQQAGAADAALLHLAALSDHGRHVSSLSRHRRDAAPVRRRLRPGDAGGASAR